MTAVARIRRTRRPWRSWLTRWPRPLAAGVRLVVVIALACVIATPQIALADDPAERSARRHYERGEKLFALKKFDDALEEYQKAFDANPIPDFLFNIGQCYRNLGDYEAAIFSYKKFLKLDPEAPNRDKVQKLIDDLEGRIEQGDTEKFGFDANNKKKQPRRADPEDGPRETQDSPVYKKWWFWTGLAVVGVAAGYGIYTLTKTSGRETDFGPINPP